MKEATKQFIVGVDSIPAWFKEQMQKGRAHVHQDEETKKIEKISISTATKQYVAKPGDVVLMLRTGMVVLPKETAKRYGEQPQKKEKEE